MAATKKKTTRKPAASKKKADKGAALATGAPRRYSFDILSEEGGDVVENVTRSVHSHFAAKKHKSTSFMSAAQVRSSMLPLRPFLMQWVFGSFGIAEKSLFEVIGPEGVGKSSLAYHMIGWGMKAGCPAYFQNTETKELPVDRIKRCLSSDKKEAEIMLNRLRRDSAHTLAESVEKLETAVATFRGRIASDKKTRRAVPLDTPIIAVIDVWGKLMGPAEAAGFYAYGADLNDADIKKKLKEVGQTSNLQHAKFAQGWCRRLPAWLEANNVILIITNHQNEKVDMAGGGGGKTATFIPADAVAMYNKTKIGGRAFNQTSSYQVIIVRKALLKDSQKNIIGKTLTLRVDKNSYGPSDRRIEYDLVSEGLQDTESTQQQALDFERAFCRWLVTKKLLDVTVSEEKYTSKQIGVDSVSAQELCRVFDTRDDLKNWLGGHLQINGYDYSVDSVKAELKDAAPIEEEMPAPPEDDPTMSEGGESGEGNTPAE